MEHKRWIGWTRILFGLLILLALSYVVSTNQSFLLKYSYYGYLGILISCFIANSTVFLPAPSSTIVFTFASVYSPAVVGTVGALGAALGEIVGYSLGYSGKVVIDDNKYQVVKQWTGRYGFGTIFLFAFLPLPLFDLVGVSSGVLRIPFFGFFIPTFLGKWLKMLIYAFLGAGMLPILSPFFESFIK